jgi:hypothetical protein
LKIKCLFAAVAASAWTTLEIAMNGRNTETARSLFPVIVLLLAQVEAQRVRS